MARKTDFWTEQEDAVLTALRVGRGKNLADVDFTKILPGRTLGMIRSRIAYLRQKVGGGDHFVCRVDALVTSGRYKDDPNGDPYLTCLQAVHGNDKIDRDVSFKEKVA